MKFVRFADVKPSFQCSKSAADSILGTIVIDAGNELACAIQFEAPNQATRRRSWVENNREKPAADNNEMHHSPFGTLFRHDQT